ncbi:hypothetical protein [Gordonia oryzae]|uniref:hypothetical protein n=1 Tax=Gordonia oryzae TaxID=2487349 RepID=UPI001FE5AAFB|nr:hypothetical protein [Gordonia oryzae]
MTTRCRDPKVADHIVERLHAAGITSTFGVREANIEELFDAAVRVGLTRSGHGMCGTRTQMCSPDTPGLNAFGPTDIAVGLAAMFPDLRVRRVTDPRDLDAATSDVLTRPGPACLVVDTDPDATPPCHPLARGLR